MGCGVCFYERNFCCHIPIKTKNASHDLSIVKRLGGSGAAKVRHLFGLCKSLGRKVMIWRVFLTVVVCLNVQNAAFTNQCGENTNHSTRNSAESRV